MVDEVVEFSGEKVEYLILATERTDAKMIRVRWLTEEEKAALVVLLKSGKWRSFGSATIEPSCRHAYYTNWPG